MMLVYILIASLFNVTAPNMPIDITREYVSYGECVSGSKKFFYENVKDEIPFPNKNPAQLDGRVNFEWSCEGFVK